MLLQTTKLSVPFFKFEMNLLIFLASLLHWSCLSNVLSQDTDRSDSQRKTEVHRHEWDANGYVFFCLCMGRFGNQAEHFLGGLAFAKALNRTLVVPPWVTYKTMSFSEWFQLDPLKDYHRVILAENFMKYLAPKHWPQKSRKGYCWLPPSSKAKCIMKEGFPFKAFWDGVGVDFDDFIVYHLSSYIDDEYVRAEWQERFPPSEHPVLAFRGAPAHFPMLPQHRPLQKYLKWANWIEREANDYISKNLRPGKFIGIHLRNEKAWIDACKYADGQASFMESPQCLGYSRYRLVTRELCDPSKHDILNAVKKHVTAMNAKYVFVATDNDPMIKDFEELLTPLSVTVRHLNPERPQIDLAVLGKSDHFIGNCISSFTAFVKRERDVNGKSSSFWAFDSDG